MLRLGQTQRMLLAETLRDIANLAAAAMVFGQFVASQTFSSQIALSGIGAWITLVLLAIPLVGERNP